MEKLSINISYILSAIFFCWSFSSCHNTMKDTNLQKPPLSINKYHSSETTNVITSNIPVRVFTSSMLDSVAEVFCNRPLVSKRRFFEAMKDTSFYYLAAAEQAPDYSEIDINKVCSIILGPSDNKSTNKTSVKINFSSLLITQKQKTQRI